jgi:hypothetical protein
MRRWEFIAVLGGAGNVAAHGAWAKLPKIRSEVSLESKKA